MKPTITIALFFLCILALAQTPASDSEIYSVVLFAHDTMVPLRNGVHLAADIYRPAVDGVRLTRKLPILL